MLAMCARQLDQARRRLQEAEAALDVVFTDEMDLFLAREELEGARSSVTQFETLVRFHEKNKNKKTKPKERPLVVGEWRKIKLKAYKVEF